MAAYHEDAGEPISRDACQRASLASILHCASHRSTSQISTMLTGCRDCVVYSSHCSKLDGRKVAVKVYEKSSLSASKLRAVKREAAMMIYMTRKRYELC